MCDQATGTSANCSKRRAVQAGGREWEDVEDEEESATVPAAEDEGSTAAGEGVLQAKSKRSSSKKRESARA